MKSKNSDRVKKNKACNTARPCFYFYSLLGAVCLLMLQGCAPQGTLQQAQETCPAPDTTNTTGPLVTQCNLLRSSAGFFSGSVGYGLSHPNDVWLSFNSGAFLQQDPQMVVAFYPWGIDTRGERTPRAPWSNIAVVSGRNTNVAHSLGSSQLSFQVLSDFVLQSGGVLSNVEHFFREYFILLRGVSQNYQAMDVVYFKPGDSGLVMVATDTLLLPPFEVSPAVYRSTHPWPTLWQLHPFSQSLPQHESCYYEKAKAFCKKARAILPVDGRIAARGLASVAESEGSAFWMEFKSWLRSLWARISNWFS